MYIICMFNCIFGIYSLRILSQFPLPNFCACVRKLRNLVTSSREEESALQLGEHCICNFYQYLTTNMCNLKKVLSKSRLIFLTRDMHRGEGLALPQKFMIYQITLQQYFIICKNIFSSPGIRIGGKQSPPCLRCSRCLGKQSATVEETLKRLLPFNKYKIHIF